MGGKLDPIKGWMKEVAGAPADDDNLKQEGNLDREAGKAKEKGEKAMLVLLPCLCDLNELTRRLPPRL